MWNVNSPISKGVKTYFYKQTSSLLTMWNVNLKRVSLPFFANWQFFINYVECKEAEDKKPLLDNKLNSSLLTMWNVNVEEAQQQ